MKGEDFLGYDVERITSEGIVVYDNVSTLPAFNTPYNSSHCVICICHRGSLDADYDSQSRSYGQNEVAIVYPNHTIVGRSATRDYQASLIVISAELFEQLCMHAINSNRFRYEESPSFRLNEEQYGKLMTAVETLRIVCGLQTPLKQDMLVRMVSVILQMIDIFRYANNSEMPIERPRLYPAFFRMLSEHCINERNVEFYSQQVCLSPRYFSTIIKQETGRSAAYWIRRYVVNSAKEMLVSDTNASLLDVSRKLQFPDQASFSRYFHRETGVTPSRYRQSRRTPGAR